MEEEIVKCKQCGANLPKNGNICEYCGCKYKNDDEKTLQLDEEFEGDIISNIGRIEEMFGDMFSDIF